MADLNGFNANEVDPNVGFEPIPAGDYEVMMIKSERKPSKSDPSGFNHYIECVFQVVTGKHKGRLLYERVNMTNRNPDCVKIARGTMSAICRAVGVMKPQDSTKLHNIPLIAKVKLVKRKDNNEPANEIDSFVKKPSSFPAQSEQTQQVEANRVEGGEEKPEWQK